MKLSLALCPVYDPHKKNAHIHASKIWSEKIISLLHGRPALKLSVFFTGQMLEALDKEHKKEREKLGEFVANKQLEFLGGAYNDAMLPLFPKKLRELQLQKHKKILSDSLMEPIGYFCKSHAWEISLIESLEKYGFEYALMPDVSVQEALGRKALVSGWFAAEYGGSFMRILTYSQNLSLVCQNSDRAEITNSLKNFKDSSGVNCILLNVDLEETVFTSQWLQAIDTAKAEGLDIEHALLCQAVLEQKAAGKVNLISYSSFAQSCRDILLRMPEINFLHKRILNVYFKANSISDDKIQEKVFESLLKSMPQSFFEKTSIGMLRDAVRFRANRSVMKAEKVLMEEESKEGMLFAMSSFFLDGNQQILFSNQYLECLIEPVFGGWLRSLAYKPSFSELACAMRDDGEVSPLFLDHICPFEFETLDQRNLWINDRQGAFLGSCESLVKKQEEKVQVILFGEQKVSHLGKDFSFKVEKVFSLKNNDSELLVSVSVTNNSFNAFSGEIATELCLGFRYDDIRGQVLKIQGCKIKTELCNGFHSDVKKIDFRDRFLGIGTSIEMSKNADVLCAPILGAGSVAAPDIAHGLRLAVFHRAKLKGQESDVFHLRIKLNGGGLFL
jgi:Zn-finger protein/polyhydroxyalkanoate synthesis regulator protein